MSASPARRARAICAALILAALLTAALAAPPAGAASAASQTARTLRLPSTYVSADRRVFVVVTGTHASVLWIGMPTFCVDGGTPPPTLLAMSAPLAGSTFESSSVNARGDAKFVQGTIEGRTVTGTAKVSYTHSRLGICSTGALSFTATR